MPKGRTHAVDGREGVDDEGSRGPLVLLALFTTLAVGALGFPDLAAHIVGSVEEVGYLDKP